MNRTAKATARKVANGTATPAESKDFRAAVLLLGWEGARGLGVVNYITHERVRSFRALAQILLEESGDEEARLDRVEEAEAEEMAADEAQEPALPRSEPAPEVTYFYATQVPAVAISDSTTVEALITEGIMGVTEGLCESGASLECSLEDPSMGILRTLPESMLPGQERTILIQCLPCYEASAEAYVRKLHRAEA